MRLAEQFVFVLFFFWGGETSEINSIKNGHSCHKISMKYHKADCLIFFQD